MGDVIDFQKKKKKNLCYDLEREPRVYVHGTCKPITASHNIILYANLILLIVLVLCIQNEIKHVQKHIVEEVGLLVVYLGLCVRRNKEKKKQNKKHC